MNNLIKIYTGVDNIANSFSELSKIDSSSIKHFGSEILYIIKVYDGNFIIKKFISLLVVSLKVKYISYRLRKKGFIISIFCVYPDVIDPKVIYELGTQASFYIDENVIPHFGKGFKGKFKKLASRLTNINPSVAAVFFIARSQHETHTGSVE